MPLWLLRFWRPLLALAVLAGCWLWFQHALSNADARGYQRAKGEDKATADAQAQSNRELARAAEKKYVVQAGVREKFFVTTVKEIHEAAAPLASCALPPDLRSLLDSADACARADPGAPGCTAGGVPPTR